MATGVLGRWAGSSWEDSLQKHILAGGFKWRAIRRGGPCRRNACVAAQCAQKSRTNGVLGDESLLVDYIERKKTRNERESRAYAVWTSLQNS